MSNFLQSHGLKPVRLLCPWNSPGKNTGVGCHFLLQGIFLTQRSNPGLLHYRQILYYLNHQAVAHNWDLLAQLNFRSPLPLFFFIYSLYMPLNILMFYSIFPDNKTKSEKALEISSPKSSVLIYRNYRIEKEVTTCGTHRKRNSGNDSNFWESKKTIRASLNHLK